MDFVADYWPEIVVGVVAGLFLLTRRGRAVMLKLARWWVSVIPARVSLWLAVSAGTLAVVAAFAFDQLDFPARAHFALALIAIQLLATGLPLLQEEAALRKLASDVAKTSDDYSRNLVPLTRAIATLHAHRPGNPKEHARGTAKTVALTAASTLVGGPNDIRANFYESVGTTPDRKLQPGPTFSVGRPDTATSVFDEATPLGAGIYAALDQNKALYCENIETAPPTGWQPQPTTWKSFISVPVWHNGKLLGMLTCDSPVPNDFDEDRNLNLLAAIGYLYAIISAC